MPLERFDARDARKFRDVQRTGPEAYELRREGIAAVGTDDPARLAFVPSQACHLGVKQRVVVQVILPADALAVRQDLRRMRVFLGRHVPGLFEQRHVDQ